MIDSVLIFRIFVNMPFNLREEFLGAIISTAVLTTVLLVCTWFHQNWARYLLIIYLLGIMLFGWTLLPCLRDFQTSAVEFSDILGISVAYLLVALILISSKDIKRLISRSSEYQKFF